MTGHIPDRVPPRVLIIGAGIGGLCLAQGLHRAGIDVAVFDRAASAVADRQGYGFSINRDGDGALRRCLPPNLYRLYRATASPAPTGDFILFTADPDVRQRYSLWVEFGGESALVAAVTRCRLSRRLSPGDRAARRPCPR
jgi:2-polyprenyl-6-methoxyphenol hydroxylase-like FAD-dependent oxidoreductase